MGGLPRGAAKAHSERPPIADKPGRVVGSNVDNINKGTRSAGGNSHWDAASSRAADAKDRENQRPVGTNQHSEGVDAAKKDVNTLRPDGNTVSYALRRLRKDRPDIHARVLAGEITAHAGMIEAGNLAGAD